MSREEEIKKEIEKLENHGENNCPECDMCIICIMIDELKAELKGYQQAEKEEETFLLNLLQEYNEEGFKPVIEMIKAKLKGEGKWGKLK